MTTNEEREVVKQVEQVIITTEAKHGDDSYYHLLNEGETGSICGAVKTESLFSGNDHANEILSRAEAEQRSLQSCEHCMTYTGER
ncbi:MULTISPECIES: hypothetical protein [Halorussus]|uniref:hypothetical protein n=1 Tax=Halorussus TaxID=1070314 RepID=UPI00209E2F16|nr:hypothetical protein [Halorussus vallis]USZ75993.1 hypothetical protein NGM07_01410 [Halorussus vallis]